MVCRHTINNFRSWCFHLLLAPSFGRQLGAVRHPIEHFSSFSSLYNHDFACSSWWSSAIWPSSHYSSSSAHRDSSCFAEWCLRHCFHVSSWSGHLHLHLPNMEINMSHYRCSHQQYIVLGRQGGRACPARPRYLHQCIGHVNWTVDAVIHRLRQLYWYYHFGDDICIFS